MLEPAFRIEEADDVDGARRLRLLGELDLATVPLLQERLRAASERKEAPLLDLSELEFIDSSGIRLLITADADARSDGWSLGFTKPGDRIARVFLVAGVASQLNFDA